MLGPFIMSTRCVRRIHRLWVGHDLSTLIASTPRRCGHGGRVSTRWRCSSAWSGDGEQRGAQLGALRGALLQLCVDRHFISPGPADTELFSRGRSCSLGPLGTELRRNMLEQWWLSVNRDRTQVFGINTLSSSSSSSSSSSRDTETDRGDHLRVVHSGRLRQILEQPGVSREQVIQEVEKILQRSSALRTNLLKGALEEFVPSLELVNRKLPFGLAETGQCFRPADASGCPAQVTEASLVWFCSPRTSSQWLDHWARQRLKWWRKFSVSPSEFSSSDVPAEQPGGAEPAGGAAASRGLRIVYNFPWGPEPVEELWSRGDAELLQTHKGVRAKLQCQNERKSVPHVVSLSGNMERGMMAFLSNSLQLLKKGDGQQRLLQRQVLKLHPLLAPVKVALDIGRGATQELRQVCEGLVHEFTESKICVWPGYLNTVQTSKEQLHNKYDEMGVLFSVVVSESTLESGLLQLRSRDTTVRETMHISEVRDFVCRYISAADTI